MPGTPPLSPTSSSAARLRQPEAEPVQQPTSSRWASTDLPTRAPVIESARSRLRQPLPPGRVGAPALTRSPPDLRNRRLDDEQIRRGIDALTKRAAQLLTIAATFSALGENFEPLVAASLLNVQEPQIRDLLDEIEGHGLMAPGRPIDERVAHITLSDVPIEKHERTIARIEAELAVHAQRSGGPFYPGPFHPGDTNLPVEERLPRDIQTLFRLAEARGFQVPAVLRPMVEAIGYPGIQFTCQAVANNVVTSAATREIARRVLEASSQPVSEALSSNGIPGWKQFMAGCMAYNVLECAAHLVNTYNAPEVKTVARLAMEVCALYIHACVYTELTQAQNTIDKARKENGLKPLIGDGSIEDIERMEIISTVAKKASELNDRLASTKLNAIVSVFNLFASNQLFNRQMLPDFVNHYLPESLRI